MTRRPTGHVSPRWWKGVVALLALLPVIRLLEDGPSSILIFTVFAIVLLWEGLQRVASRVPIPLPALFSVYAVVFSGLTQLFVQLEGFETTFSANPVIHFFQALVIYVCLMFVWFLVLRKYEAGPGVVFAINGLWGVVFERMGAVLLTLDPLMYLFVFVVYGSFASIPVLLTAGRFPQSRARLSLKRSLLVFVWLSVSFVAATLIVFTLELLGFK